MLLVCHFKKTEERNGLLGGDFISHLWWPTRQQVKNVYDARDKDCMCVSLLQPPGGRKSKVQKFACLGISGQVSYDTGSYACQPTTACAIVFLNWVLQNRTEGPCFFAVIESKGEERRDHIHTDLLQ
jgi:hypothetical protein